MEPSDSSTTLLKTETKPAVSPARVSVSGASRRRIGAATICSADAISHTCLHHNERRGICIESTAADFATNLILSQISHQHIA